MSTCESSARAGHRAGVTSVAAARLSKSTDIAAAAMPRLPVGGPWPCPRSFRPLSPGPATALIAAQALRNTSPSDLAHPLLHASGSSSSASSSSRSRSPSQPPSSAPPPPPNRPCMSSSGNSQRESGLLESSQLRVKHAAPADARTHARKDPR